MPVQSARVRRHEHTKAEILDAARALASERGLTAFSMRDLAEAVGLRAPSLYSYVDSKAAIYDALFLAGNRELVALAREWAAATPPDPHAAARGFVEFCTSDATRYQLLFQRTIPGWSPSTLAGYSIAA